MMVVLASGFLTFLGFLFAGLIALAFTAALDRSLGKERALLLFSVLLFLFALWRCTPETRTIRGSPDSENTVPGDRLDVAGEPYADVTLLRRPDFRNPFQKHSDTRPLPPVVLDLPPWFPLPFELPPTVPGPAPGARRLLEGELPRLQAADGTSIPAVPEPRFADYQPVADDVYDWIRSGGRKTYVYVRAIRQEGRVYEDDDPGFVDKLLTLASHLPGWEGMQVDYAMVGSEEIATRNLEPTAVLKKRRDNVTTAPANHFDQWFARRSAEVLYREALEEAGLGADPTKSPNIQALRQAAARMAGVGRTGKEDKAGWRRAAELLEAALTQARANAAPAVRVEILEDLVEAYVALRDEKSVLRVLSEYARTSPGRPEPWLWLGRFQLRALGMPVEALAYFEAAIARSARNEGAWIGKGDALTALGRHDAALAAYQQAGSGAEARVRVAEALLRLGRLDRARGAVAAALGQDADSPRALLAEGAIAYAAGDLDTARASFEKACTVERPEALDALEYRAQACYDLGLTLWRQQQTDAALAAFLACERALEYGAAPGRFDDETVSPAFGRALVALAAGNEGGMRSELQAAREQAPRVSYHDVLAGIVASQAQDDAAAVRAFERAMRLAEVYPELDGWLAKTRLRLGELALDAGTPIKEASQDFEAAVAFAVRASETEAKVSPKAFGAQLREAWILLGAEHLPARQRWEAAKAVTNRILSRIDREQPAALALRGYCNYRLAEYGTPAFEQAVDHPTDPCIRDFQLVLNKVPAEAATPWMPWREYAARALDQVKHWLSLEEKLVSFDPTTLAQEWEVDESGGVRAQIEDDILRLDDDARTDGTLEEPTFVMTSSELFFVGTFEEVSLMLRIPSRDQRDEMRNTITFGVQVMRSSRRAAGRARYAGIGVFYDRGKIALRIGGGQNDRFKEGDVLRLDPEEAWPSDEWVQVRIVRTDEREGRMQVWLDADPEDGDEGKLVIEDLVSGFKGGTRTNASLWIGGFSPQAQRWFVEIKDIRVVRRTR